MTEQMKRDLERDGFRCTIKVVADNAIMVDGEIWTDWQLMQLKIAAMRTHKAFPYWSLESCVMDKAFAAVEKRYTLDHNILGIGAGHAKALGYAIRIKFGL